MHVSSLWYIDFSNHPQSELTIFGFSSLSFHNVLENSVQTWLFLSEKVDFDDQNDQL